MATVLPPIPPPLAPQVARFDAQGRPTVVQVEYERKLQAFLEALRLFVTGT